MTTDASSGCCCCKAALGLILMAIGYAIYKFFMNKPRKSPLKEDYEKGMVYLYQFGRAKGIPNLSPFCLKLETWLRMAKIPYEVPECSITTRSTEGMVPFLEYNGQEYPDSSLAIRDMTAIFGKESMDSHLTKEQRAVERCFETAVEYSLIVTVAIIRFSETFDEFFTLLATHIPKPLAPIILRIARLTVAPRMLKKFKAASFVGRHSRSEMLNIAREDLRAISAYLGSKKFFHGDQPSRIDASLFGSLAEIVYSPFDIPQKEFITGDLMNLKAYCDRMKERFWPDWDELSNPKQ